MGLAIESLNVSMEKRYIGFSINKDPDGTNRGVIEVSIGYYDNEGNGEWLPVKNSFIRLNSDALAMLFSLKPSQLGLTDPMLIQSMDTVIYGVIKGDIKLTASVHITIKNAAGESVAAQVIVKRQGAVLSQYYVNDILDINMELILGASIEIVATGYETFTKTYSALSGNKTLNAVLVALPQTDPVAG